MAGKSYLDFCLEASSYSFDVAVLMFTGYALFTEVCNVNRAAAQLISLVLLITGCLLPGWLLVVSNFMQRLQAKRFVSDGWVLKLMNSHVLSGSIWLCLRLIYNASEFHYEQNRYTYSPEYTAVVLFPLLMQLSTNLTTPTTALLSWLMSFCSIIASLVYFTSAAGIEALFCCISCGLMMFEVARRQWNVYRKSQRTLEDSTEIRNTDTKLQSQADLLKVVIANFTHDLMTPIQALEMGIDTMQSVFFASVRQNGADDDETWDLLSSMRGTLSLMSMIVHRCTDVFAGSDGSTLVPHLESFAFAQSVAKVCRAMSDMQSRIQIEAHFAPDLGAEIHTDKRWFEDNMLCMLSNAVKFSREIPDVDVEVRVLKCNKVDISGRLRKMMIIEVWDSGFEIEESRRPKLFDRPEVTRREQMGGAGLGLYSMALRAQALRGQVGYRNRTDGKATGSIFWFAIPCTNDSAAGSSSEEVWSPQPHEGPDHGDGGSGRPSERPKSSLSSSENSQKRNKAKSISFYRRPEIRRNQSRDDEDVADCNGPRGISFDDLQPLDSSGGDREYDIECGLLRGDGDAGRSSWRSKSSSSSGDGRDGGSGSSSQRFSGFMQSLQSRSASFAMHLSSPSKRPSYIDLQDVCNDDEEACLDETLPVRVLRRPSKRLIDNFFEPSQGPPAGASSAGHTLLDGVSLNILACDDSIAIMKIMKMSLTRAGHSVEVASNGSIALSKMMQKQYDVVLMDMQMDIMDGCEATSRFRQFEAVMLVSGASDWGSAMGGREPEPADAALEWFLGASITGDADSAAAAAVAADSSASVAVKSNRQNFSTSGSHGSQGSHVSRVPVVRPSVDIDSVSSWRSDSMGARTRKQLIIGMSANIDNETRQQALACGMDGFLPQPFAREAMMVIVRERLNLTASMGVVAAKDSAKPSAELTQDQAGGSEPTDQNIVGTAQPTSADVIQQKHPHNKVPPVMHFMDSSILTSMSEPGQFFDRVPVALDLISGSLDLNHSSASSQLESARVKASVRQDGDDASRTNGSHRRDKRSHKSRFHGQHQDRREEDCESIHSDASSTESNEPEREVNVYLGKGFEEEGIDWSVLRRGGNTGERLETLVESEPEAGDSNCDGLGEDSVLASSHTMHIQGENFLRNEEASGNIAASASVGPEGAIITDPLNVLIVEDSLPIMKAMSMNLRRAKHTVEQAVNGLIGLECMKQKEFDVVMMDLQMPEMGGCEAVRLFRAFEVKELAEGRRSRRQLIIGMSANSVLNVSHEALGSGMDLFYPKPFRIDVMVSIVHLTLKQEAFAKKG